VVASGQLELRCVCCMLIAVSRSDRALGLAAACADYDEQPIACEMTVAKVALFWQLLASKLRQRRLLVIVSLVSCHMHMLQYNCSL